MRCRAPGPAEKTDDDPTGGDVSCRASPADGMKQSVNAAGSCRSSLVGGDVGGAAAVARGGLRPLDVQVEQLHLQKGNSPAP